MLQFWLSFAGEAFLGVCVVEADNPSGAWMTATLAGLNPGGEVAIVEIPSDVPQVPQRWLNRLLNLEQVREIEADINRAWN